MWYYDLINLVSSLSSHHFDNPIGDDDCRAVTGRDDKEALVMHDGGNSWRSIHDDLDDVCLDDDSVDDIVHNDARNNYYDNDDVNDDNYDGDGNDDELVIADASASTYINGINDDVAAVALTSLSFNNTNTIHTAIAEPVNAEVDAKPLALIRFLHLLITFSPSKSWKEMLQHIEPTVTKWASAIHFILLSLYITFEILLELSFELHNLLKPYRLDLLLPCFVGIIICFFGGSFVTTIAAVEAFRIVGYDSTMQCVKDLSNEFHAILEASKKDLGELMWWW